MKTTKPKAKKAKDNSELEAMMLMWPKCGIKTCKYKIAFRISDRFCYKHAAKDAVDSFAA